jgi:hypothetical protein
MLALRVEKDAEGVSQRGLMCDSDGLWQAKDRSGKLDHWEERRPWRDHFQSLEQNNGPRKSQPKLA